MKRRDFVSLAGMAGVGSLVRPALPIARPAVVAASSMVVGCQRSPTDARRLDHFKRHGVEHICGFPPDGDTDPVAWTVESLTKLRELCEAHGVALDMIEFPMLSSASIDALSPQHAASPPRAAGAGKGIMLGKEPERQREIDQVCEIIRACARAGIPAAKYNMNLLGVLRTADTPGRGGSRYSTWRLAEAKEEHFNLRFQAATGQLDNSARLGDVRRQVARLATLLREREIAAAEAAEEQS